MALPCNVGGADKTIRIVLGIVFIALALLLELSPVLNVVLWVVAAIALVTAFVGFCPLNKLLGLDTCKQAV